jgi:glycerol-3-phosphate dehydrogenase
VNRDISALIKEPFDLLVIGGGIYGAWIALDATLRGLKTAIVDKGDWGCGTSMASTKLIHGGLRYLENLRLDLVHTALEERRDLTAIAPHLVQPQRFFIPFYEDNRVGPIKLKTGLWLYDLMAGKGQPVPPHSRLGRSEAVKRFPFLNPDGLSGGYFYGDCQTDDGRLVLAIVNAALRAGAVAVNYVKSISLMSRGRMVMGAVLQDLPSGASFEVPAAVVVNAAGPWVPLVDDIHLLSSQIRYSKGVHLVLPPLPTAESLLMMTGKDSRVFFMVPWYGRTLLGTTDSPYNGHPDAVDVDTADVDYLLAEAARHVQGLNWNRDSVLGGFAGLRTLQNEPSKALSQVTREWTWLEPRPRLLVSIGGKITTARLDAAKLVDRAMRILGRPTNGEPPTGSHRLPGTPSANFRLWRKEMMPKAMATGLDQSSAAFLLLRHGADADAIIHLIREQPALARRITHELPFCRAEMLYSLRHEMVVHLEDLLRRRLPLIILMRPDLWLVEELSAMAAAELGWSPADRQAEVDHLMSRWWSVA